MNENRLLILDDDLMVGQTIGQIAQSAGFETHLTTRADAFFEQVAQWSPSHIALDLIMPDMDGVEVMAELARSSCRAHIIITSGVGSRVLDAAARSAAEHGLLIVGVLSKPFSPGMLRDALLKAGHLHAQSGSSPETAASGRDITQAEFKQALERHQIEIVYQPKVSCHTSALNGFEALARWNSPERGIVPPDRFIPLAEAGGLIGEMTRQIITGALEWFARILEIASSNQSGDGQASGPAANLSLGINLSARALDDTAIVEFVTLQCSEYGIDRRQVAFELTETSAMGDPVGCLDLLTRLRMKGFQLSIDDFGTGFSSMLQLVRLPFSEIKIDKSFVMSSARSEESRVVIRSIVDLGHSLGLKATAEGVEDLETLEYLKEIDCDLAQGYLISHPMDGDRAIAWARKHLDSWH